jgi:hypothetical protein
VTRLFLLPHDPQDQTLGPRCSHCTGNMALDAEEGIPDLFDFRCMACGKSAGEILGRDLRKMGFTRAQVRGFTARGTLPIWSVPTPGVVKTIKRKARLIHEAGR